MRIAIIAAMEKEIKNLKEMMKDLDVLKVQHLTFYQGKINNNEIILVVSGIGKVLSGMLLATLVNTFSNIDHVINVGVSGGNGKYLSRGEVVVGLNYSYADCDCTALDNYPYGQIFGYPKYFEGDKEIINKIKKNSNLKDYKLGTILTGDKFYANNHEIQELTSKHFIDCEAMAFDMESTALAHACYCYNIPFVAIRAISDIIGCPNQEESYYDYVEIACKKASDILYSLLETL